MNPETVGYEFFRLPETERGYAVYESFTSEEAEEAHRKHRTFCRTGAGPDRVYRRHL